MQRQTLIVSCTAKKHFQDTLLHQSLVKIQTQLQDAFETKFYCENKTGLSKMYNAALKEYGKMYQRIVYIHDDVELDDAMLDSKLDDAMNNLGYDIVGLAGALNPAIKHPALWHIMSKREDHRGYAGHFASNGIKFMTGFGSTPSRVAIVDGLFAAVKTKTALEKNWQWNENFEFHHYDIASCIDANYKGMRVGVYPINAFHQSPGLMSLDDVAWSQSNKKFLQLYSQQY